MLTPKSKIYVLEILFALVVAIVAVSLVATAFPVAHADTKTLEKETVANVPMSLIAVLLWFKIRSLKKKLPPGTQLPSSKVRPLHKLLLLPLGLAVLVAIVLTGILSRPSHPPSPSTPPDQPSAAALPDNDALAQILLQEFNSRDKAQRQQVEEGCTRGIADASPEERAQARANAEKFLSKLKAATSQEEFTEVSRRVYSELTALDVCEFFQILTERAATPVNP